MFKFIEIKYQALDKTLQVSRGSQRVEKYTNSKTSKWKALKLRFMTIDPPNFKTKIDLSFWNVANVFANCRQCSIVIDTITLLYVGSKLPVAGNRQSKEWEGISVADISSFGT